MSTYLERAEAEWDRMSLAERIEALDTGENDLLGFVRWWDMAVLPDFHSDDFYAVVDAVAAYLRQHPRFAAWLDREAQRQQALEEEPDDWED